MVVNRWFYIGIEPISLPDLNTRPHKVSFGLKFYDFPNILRFLFVKSRVTPRSGSYGPLWCLYEANNIYFTWDFSCETAWVNFIKMKIAWFEGIMGSLLESSRKRVNFIHRTITYCESGVGVITLPLSCRVRVVDFMCSIMSVLFWELCGWLEWNSCAAIMHSFLNYITFLV